jgi:hypothetical protein
MVADTFERLEPRTPRPSDPLIELDAREPLLLAVEHTDEGVLE